MKRSSKTRAIGAGAAIAAAIAVMAWAIPAPAAEPTFPVGSRIGLVPPAGMTPSPTFMGFEDRDKNATILLATFPADAFAQLDKSMVPDALKKQGLDVKKREAIELGVGRGFLLSGRQSIDGRQFRKFMLIAAAGKVTALVTVQVPDPDKTYTDQAVRGALATITVREVPDTERLGLLPFTIGDMAGFRVEDVLPGRALTLVDAQPASGQNSQNSSANASTDQNADNSGRPIDSGRPINARFLIAVLPGGPTGLKDADQFARMAFAQIGGIKNVRIQDAEPLRIGGQPGYEILANATDPQGSELRVVQWLRFGSGAYLQMVGMARANVWLDVFARLRKVRDSIEPK